MLTKGRSVWYVLTLEKDMGSFLHEKFPDNCPKPCCYMGKIKERQKDENLVRWKIFKVYLTKNERIKMHNAFRESGLGAMIMKEEFF